MTQPVESKARVSASSRGHPQRAVCAVAARDRDVAGSRHHLFGFHDVTPWSVDLQHMLALQVERIDHPPLADTVASIGVIDMAVGAFIRHDDTVGWNFPQGARQIWLSDGKRYAYNCPDGPLPRCRVRTQSGQLVRELPWGVAAVSPCTDELFSIDFGRVHRAGGYGHSGVSPWRDNAPSRDSSGVLKVNVATGAVTPLASLEECRRAVAGGNAAHAEADLDYVTHVVPSPNGDHLAFLYRSWLADGGMDTALCVVSTYGGGFRVLHRGNLSHFDWRDDHSVVIWGPRRQLVTALRGRGAAKRGWGSLVLRRIKDCVRPFVRGTGLLSATFLLVPLDGSPPKPFCEELFTGDGHPSFCPSDRSWMLCDTYPDQRGNRDLFLVDTTRHTKHMLGVFHEPTLPLDASYIDKAAEGVDAEVLKLVGRERYARARSGLHCDLHPRWRRDGAQVTFDSLHDGTRQIHTVHTSHLLNHIAGNSAGGSGQ